MEIPLSVPAHLAEADKAFWTPQPADFNWGGLSLDKAYAISGSAFIDLAAPNGSMGNPFAIVIGRPVKDFDNDRCHGITQLTRTPETVFIRDYHPASEHRYSLLLTVLTPTGKELGACAHGFTGAIQTLRECGQIAPGSEIIISTTLGTTAKVLVSASGVIAIEFEVQDQRALSVPAHTINAIFQTKVLSEDAELPVLSVGSPKLTIEVSPEIFEAVQRKLNSLDYDTLLAFEDEERIPTAFMYFVATPRRSYQRKLFR